MEEDTETTFLNKKKKKRQSGSLGKDKRHYVEDGLLLGRFLKICKDRHELWACAYQQVMTAELDVHIAILVHSISHIRLCTSTHVLFHTCLECL